MPNPVFVCSIVSLSFLSFAKAEPEIDFKKHDPMQVLEILEKATGDWVPVSDAPEGWLKAEHIPKLIEKLGSKTSCAGIHSGRDSRISTVDVKYGPKEKGRSTVGREAAHMILSYRHGLFPKSPAFSIDWTSNWTDKDDDEIRDWWKEVQTGLK